MGTKVAPSYANLFMSELEEKFIETHTLKPKVWFRYIDDIFFIWEHGENSLKEWYEHLNNYHKTIKFTLEWSRKTINFLDTTVKKDKTIDCIQIYIQNLQIQTVILDLTQHIHQNANKVFHIASSSDLDVYVKTKQTSN